jgi:biopolymer transport protein ExbD
VLELRDDGSYAINSQPVPKQQLDQQIHAVFDNRPAKLLFIKAGPNRIYQDVIEAMDVARGAGVQIIGFTPKEAK